MKNRQSLSTTARHLLISLALASLSTGGLAATPASTDLSDVPISTVSSTAVKPNIMFILDNSGSMFNVFMPDTVNSTGGACASNNSNGTNQCSTTSRYSFKNSGCNGVYYDPKVTYTPPVDYLGVSYANATFTAAKRDGFGVSSTGTCDLTNKFSATSTSCGSEAAYYYKYTGSSPSTPLDNICYADSKYTKVTISSTSGLDRDGDGTISAAEKDERQNFANWYTYYRTRQNTMKTAMGQAFSGIGSSYRVGLSTIDDNSGHSYNYDGSNFINVADFDSSAGTASQKYKWYQTLYATPVSAGTPLQAALQRVGEYYRTGSMGYTGGTPSVDPVQYSCQQNFAILSTDGYWNSNTVTLGNQDKTVPTLPATVAGLTPGSAYPPPFYEGPTATSNTVADVAMYYWATDLRPSSWPAAIATDNVKTSTADPAKWQHMTTFTIGLAPGTLAYPSAEAGLNAGTTNWPVPLQNNATAIDDLWHAAVNGRGQYFEATSTSTIVSGLTSILSAINGMTSTASAATLSSIAITGSNNLAYSSNYFTGDWSGELQAYTISTTNGTFSSTPAWTTGAQAQLDARSTNSSDTRLIASFDPVNKVGIPFQWTNLSSAQQTNLNSTKSLLEYLRGWRCQEIGNSCGSGLYRTRGHVLGDIINSEGTYVGAPTLTYADSGYSSYKASQSGRAQTVLIGSNDGMLHAFDGTTTGGAERWAYVPNLVMGTIKNLSNPPLSYQHKFYVDGTPVAGDVDFNQDWYTTGLTAAPDWRTIVVGGLNHGGKGFYALDVTNPVASTESGVAAKVLWEFPNPNNSTHASVVSNVGFSYGNPVITKVTNEQGSPAWVVLVTSGYHNGFNDASCSDCSGGDGIGYLYVLDVQTGNLLKTLSTNSGTATSPSGLAKIAPYIDDYFSNNTALRAYAGDLDGNVWRFNFSGVPTAWTVQKWATLKDPSNVVQPITVLPAIADVNGKHMIYVGTGRYLGSPDVALTQVQSMWALKDDLSGVALGDARTKVNTTTTGIMKLSLVQASSTTITSSSTPSADLNTNLGWIVDLDLHAGERPTDPAYIYGTLAFTANIPSSSACAAGGSSWLYFLDASNGGNSPFSTGAQAGTFIGDVISSRVVPYTIDGTPYVTFSTSQPVGDTFDPPVPVCPTGNCSDENNRCSGANCTAETPPANSGLNVIRVHWREILN